MLPLSSQAAQAVRDWLELRPEAAEHARVFTAKWGAPLSKNGLTTCLARALAGAGITREGITLQYAEAHLQHADAARRLRLALTTVHARPRRLDTTAIYLHTGLTDLQEAMVHHPLAGFASDCHNREQRLCNRYRRPAYLQAGEASTRNAGAARCTDLAEAGKSYRGRRHKRKHPA